MESFMFSAAVDGDTSVLNEGIIAERGENSYVAKTPDLENNIIHLAVQNKKSTFIDAAINRFPVLLQQKNSKGNTPFHEAAELGNKETIILLVLHLQETTSDVPYYMEKNNQGDTPLHAALRAQNLDAAYELFIMVVQYHREEILATQNNSKETPLHLYVRFCAGEFLSMNLEHADKRELIEKLITTYPPAMLIKDSDGLTPHMRAAQYGRVLVALRILTYNKQLSECRDIKGRSFLHNLRLKMAHLNASDKEYTLWTCNSILSLHGIHALLFSQDQDGNTPLHLAIADRDFNVAQLFLQQCAKNESSGRKKLIMSLQNSDGKTILDLIDSLSDIPPKLKSGIMIGKIGLQGPV
ncbi:uncharacterized protein LOC104907766 [Beta vulgaris subsp. vulgaris]|uniref:uncharacterized protein LOC104907766 n=1 Tax=Beta vulgaris subsp. vulgaris TaxID=3555 RepID=UPI0025478DF1|nr:uncharacterized protein LOC104907766 [Beta vulgaris subsp. vulgaris]